MKLRTLKDGRHVARWIDPLSGKERQQSLDKLGLTNAEARLDWVIAKSKDLATLRATIAAGHALAAPVKLRKAVDDFLAGYTNAKTLEGYSTAVTRFAALCVEHGARQIQDIRPPMLSLYRDDAHRQTAEQPAPGGKRGSKARTARRRSAQTVNKALTVVKTFLNWARRRGLTPHLSADAIKDGLQPVKVKREAIAFLRPTKLRELLEAALRHDAATFAMTRAEHSGEGEPGTTPRHPPIAPFLLGALLTGCRFSELAGLRWSEVDLDSERIELPASRVKTGHARTITLAETPNMLALLRSMRLRRRGVLVFDMPRDLAESCRRRLVTRFKAPSFTWHDLRRTCGTVLTNAPGIYGGASAFLSAKRLGHSVQVAEARYAGALPGLPHEAKSLEAAVGIEDLAVKIVRRAGGVMHQHDGAAVTG